jgi:phytoene dehydrogenase-like protein
MKPDNRKIVIVGGGIAGLCTAVYAQKCGYQVEVLEMHEAPGGLATSWQRGGYTFETCLHWLLGSNPAGDIYRQWKEVFDIEKLRFVHHEEFVRIENDKGDSLRIYSNLDQLESEMLKRAPQERKEIHRFISSVRHLCTFKLPDPAKSWMGNWRSLLSDAPHLLLFEQLAKMTCAEYGMRFQDPLLRAFFMDGDSERLSALALFFSLAWMHNHDAEYPIGGSQAVIRLIVEKLLSLGGQLRCGAMVEKILVEQDVAVGVQLATGEKIAADWVISAADGHATIYDLLQGRYKNSDTDKIYRELEPFSSYVQVSLGVARDLSQQPGFLVRLLDKPLQIDPGTLVSRVSFRIFNYDPTFAPQGKTAITCFLPTRDFEYWLDLQRRDPAAYQAEKQRIADEIIALLGRQVANIEDAVEVVDVSTPATVIRYTGNWKGSMEGWLITPQTGFRQLTNTLSGLDKFVMVGQWVMPGGGLPSGLMTARSAINTICEHDNMVFAA